MTIGISQHEISRRCIRQFDRFHNVATKPDAGRAPKVTDHEKRLIKLQQLRNNTCSLPNLVRYAYTDLNLFISRPTISDILQHDNMISYILPRKS